ncbi:MAG: helix-turn-helix transcriptional regulator [Desulfobacteraceae bacterium]|nr:helix-turn-helix transcriptional regulator [Desulfobacteraceae bacterium]
MSLYENLRQLKALMVLLGIKQTEVASRARVTRQMVSAVLSGRKKSWRVMASARRLVDKKLKGKNGGSPERLTSKPFAKQPDSLPGDRK